MPANKNIQEQEDQNKTGGSLILDMSSTNNIIEKVYGWIKGEIKWLDL